jgi:hypothetical protein
MTHIMMRIYYDGMPIGVCMLDRIVVGCHFGGGGGGGGGGDLPRVCK